MKWWLYITIGTWLVIGGLIVNYNLAPLGSIRMNWTDLTRPTANFSWHTEPVESGSIANAIIIAAGENKRFSVTLPRGFRSGEVAVEYQADQTGGGIKLAAVALAGKTVAEESAANPAVMSFDWTDLAAHGHRFEFSISPAAAETPVLLKSINITARR